jgi:hypothetical protein
MKRALLLLLLGLIITGCATAGTSAVPWPSPLTLTQPPTVLGDAGLVMTLAPDWSVAATGDSFLSWQGPSRAGGRAIMRLIYQDDYQHSLDDLAVSAARVDGVSAPSAPAVISIAGTEGRQSSGLTGASNHKVIAVAWRRNIRTYVLILQWTEEADGRALAAMVGSIALAPSNAGSP